MRIVFISNYYNHHQSSLSESLYSLTNGNFYFIETIPIEEERKKMGWNVKSVPSFVLRLYEGEAVINTCKELIDLADIVIIGDAPMSLIQKRLHNGKLVFKYTERFFKNKFLYLTYPWRILKYYYDGYFEKNMYILCASAYAANDFSKLGNFENKTFKWGYYPEMKEYPNIQVLMDKKKKNSILWVARLIDWKHPEIAINLAKMLKEKGYNFTLNLIGDGHLKNKIKSKIYDCELTDCIHLLGVKTPEEVRACMEESQIFIFTSDFNEGWGAVLNEAMNSGCSVVASHAIGSTPFLIKNNDNGFIYKNGDINDLFLKVCSLLNDKYLRENFGVKAYNSIYHEWNAMNASKRLLQLVDVLQDNPTKSISSYSDGPCSRAQKLKNNWFYKQSTNKD